MSLTTARRRRCIERIFDWYEDIKTFCNELMDGTLEDLCDCVSVHVINSLKDKVEQCSMGPISHSQTDRYRDVRRWWFRSLLENQRKHSFLVDVPIILILGFLGLNNIKHDTLY